jgi:hypothetical protein
MWLAPEFHQAPRPLTTDLQARALSSPCCIRGLKRVRGFFHCRHNTARSLRRIQPSKSSKVFFFQRQSESFNLNTTGIFVSEWVDDSYEDAIANLKQAVQNKQQAVDLIDAAIDNEKTANRILCKLPYQMYPDGVTKKDVRKACIQIVQTARQEEYVVKLLEMHIRWINCAMLPLTPPAPVSGDQ